MMTLRLFVICTDKGQHQRARLGELNLFKGDLIGEFVGGSNILGQQANPVPEDAVGVRIERGNRIRVEIRCSRCSRHIQWREETAREVVVRMCADSPLKGSGPTWRDAWLDISHLP
jgi:hypothetical protein